MSEDVKDRKETRKAVVGVEGVGEGGIGVLRLLNGASSNTIHDLNIEVV